MSATLPSAVSLAANALGLGPIGRPAESPLVCCATGQAIAVGESYVPASFGAGFTDGRALMRHPGIPPVLSGHLAPFFSKAVMDKCQRVIFTDEGAYPIGKGENRVWFMLNPPTPPFVVIFATSKTQHMVWRAAVTLDADLWHVQHGRRSLTVHLPTVHTAVKLARELCEAAAKRGQKKKPPRSPFNSLDPDMSDRETGVIRPDMWRLAEEDPTYRPHVAALEQLGPGELWAIGTLLFRSDAPVKPDRIVLNQASVI